LTVKIFPLKFFYPLEVKLRDGGALKLNCVRGSEENFVQFLRLFQPISVHITSNENYMVSAQKII
jgi:hypothetical protein